MRDWHRRKEARRWKARSVARAGVAIALVAGYAVYWVLTPTLIQVPKIQPSASEIEVLTITLQNPTLKFVSGKIESVQTEVDLGGPLYASKPYEYPFSILPMSSVQIDVAMNFRVLRGVDYDINMYVDGAGKQTVVVTLPQPK